jgi:hypothetical protein
VLFADLKGSVELLADRDPEDARKLLDQGWAVDLASLFPHDLRMDVVRYRGLLAAVLSWALLEAPLVGGSTLGPSV